MCFARINSSRVHIDELHSTHHIDIRSCMCVYGCMAHRALGLLGKRVADCGQDRYDGRNEFYFFAKFYTQRDGSWPSKKVRERESERKR